MGKCGSTENMTKEEIQYLAGKSQPGRVIEYVKLDGEYKNRIYIPVHGVELMTLDKKV